MMHFHCQLKACSQPSRCMSEVDTEVVRRADGRLALVHPECKIQYLAARAQYEQYALPPEEDLRLTRVWLKISQNAGLN